MTTAENSITQIPVQATFYSNGLRVGCQPHSSIPGGVIGEMTFKPFGIYGAGNGHKNTILLSGLKALDAFFNHFCVDMERQGLNAIVPTYLFGNTHESMAELLIKHLGFDDLGRVDTAKGGFCVGGDINSIRKRFELFNTPRMIARLEDAARHEPEINPIRRFAATITDPSFYLCRIKRENYKCGFSY